MSKLTRNLSAFAALGALLHVTPLFADDGPSSAFHNVGYSVPIADATPVPAEEPAPLATVSDQASQPGPVSVDSSYLLPSSGDFSPAPACAPSCTCKCCSEEKVAKLAAAAKASHKPLFYLNDFSYLSDPCYDGALLGDSLKRIGCDGFMMDFGGQYRARVHREENFRGLGITGGDDDFLLHRLRLYMNTEIGDNLRVFVEGLHADSNYENLGIRPIEENHLDLQNAFVDVKLLDGDNGKLVARAGRQEVALGGQRYVSPLDWANTRRTFDGGRLMYSKDNWNVDGFWLATTVRDFRDFDESNENQALYGVHATNNAFRNGSLDTYWIAFDDETAGFYFDSIGARYNGKLGGLLFETEGAYQFGQNSDGSDHDAGFFVAGLGKQFVDHAWKPTSWIYLDWASGDDQQGAGNGHHHFQPLAHKYNGFMDLYGRRNLVDFNILTTMQISKKVKALLWYHNFWLENQRDTPYSVVMTPQQAGVAPADSHLGNELDFVLSCGISPRSDIQFGYSRFWAGDYYDSPGLTTRFGTPLTKDTADADFFWAQYTLNF